MISIKINPNIVACKQLVKGTVYADTLESNKVTLLKFLGYDEEGEPFFEYVAGIDCYGKNPDGTIPFIDGDDEWYEVLEMIK